MINLKPERIDTVESEYYKKIKKVVDSRLKKTKKSSALTSKQFLKVESFVNSNLKKIILADREGLLDVNTKALAIHNSNSRQQKNLKKDLKSIFRYASFRDSTVYSTLDLVLALEVKVCPYCNMNLVANGKLKTGTNKLVPAIDHYYPQSSFPTLGLSLYNLIPACTMCNSNFKGEKNPDDENILYPYAERCHVKHFKFMFFPLTIGAFTVARNNFKLIIETSHSYLDAGEQTKISEGLDFFSLAEVYTQNHYDLISELVNKTRQYSARLFQTMNAAYGLNFEDSYKLLYEVYYPDDKLGERPLSKLKKDLYHQFRSR